MGILSKKNNHLLRSLSSNFKFNWNFDLRRKWSTSCSWTRVNSPSLHFPQWHRIRPKTAAASGSKLLLKQFSEKASNGGIKYEFALLSPENFSSHNYCSFENRWLENYTEFAPTCNGLLYVYNKSGDAGVWNPSTEEGIELASHRKPATTIVDVSAFGFDSKSRDYKVVRFVDSCIGDEKDTEEIDCTIGVELYSFKSNSWKWISDDRDVVYDFYSPPVYVNGCAYWLCKGFILMFDFADESLSCIDLPHTGKIFDGRSYVLDLVEFDGSLGGIVYPRFGIRDPCEMFARKSFEVWVMTGGGRWSKEVIVPACEAKRPMVLWRNSQLLFETEGRTETLLVYDLHTNEFIEHVIHGRSGNVMYIPYDESNGSSSNVELIPYVESMLPIHEQLQLQGFKSLPWFVGARGNVSGELVDDYC